MLIETGAKTGLGTARAISTKRPFQVEPGAENPVAELLIIALAFGPALRNALEPTVGASPRKRTAVSEVVFRKASTPIDVRVVDRVIEISEVAARKA